MKINKTVFTKISLGAFVLLLLAKVFIVSIPSFLAISVIIGIAVASIYYSICDQEGNIRS